MLILWKIGDLNKNLIVAMILASKILVCYSINHMKVFGGHTKSKNLMIAMISDDYDAKRTVIFTEKYRSHRNTWRSQ